MTAASAFRESLRIVLIAATLTAVSRAASGQPSEIAGVRIDTPKHPPLAFGTSGSTIIQVPATACGGVVGTIPVSGTNGWVYAGGTADLFDCPLDPPTGAVLEKLEIVAYDASDLGELAADLVHCPTLTVGDLCTGVPLSPTTGTSASPFIGRGVLDLTPYSLGVNKGSQLYFVRVATGGTGPELQFREIDVSYHLRVSTPAPGTQTFGDVPPTFLYWKAIEALAASGITGGCGSGNFCPNQNVTRGEAAAFFARALGLHFPN